MAAAKGLRNMPSVERFIVRYPGTIETTGAKASPGLPIWVGVQHFFNLFLMIFIIRSGVQILSDHPRLVLDAAQHARQGLVPRPEAGSERSVVDREAGLHQPAAARSACPGSGTPSASPAGGTSGPTPSGC